MAPTEEQPETYLDV